MNATKITLAIAVTSVMVVIVLAPLVLSQALAKRTTTTTCEIGGSTREGSCPGHSGSNDQPNQCQSSTTKAGQGKGKGEIKDSSSSC